MWWRTFSMSTVVLAVKRSSSGFIGHELHDEYVGDVVLLVRLEDVVLEVGRSSRTWGYMTSFSM